MLNICGLWVQKDKNGESMMQGNVNPYVKFFVFKNKNKRNEKDPDYYLKIAPREKAEREVKKEESAEDAPF